jgi:hypothetical protein
MPHTGTRFWLTQQQRNGGSTVRKHARTLRRHSCMHAPARTLKVHRWPKEREREREREKGRERERGGFVVRTAMFRDVGPPAWRGNTAFPRIVTTTHEPEERGEDAQLQWSGRKEQDERLPNGVQGAPAACRRVRSQAPPPPAPHHPPSHMTHCAEPSPTHRRG